MNFFGCNVGTKERVARVLVGGFVTSLWFWGPQTPWALVGLVPLVTGLAGNCPLYTILGMNTCKRPQNS